MAAGARPVVPTIPGLQRVEYQTSDTIMRIDQVPASLIIVGGGFIAAEMGHVFEAFGAAVTNVQRGSRLLTGEDDDISRRFTERAAERFRLRLSAEIGSVEPHGSGVVVRLTSPQGPEALEGDVLLIATGRRPNTDLLEATTGGLVLDDDGHIVTDDHYRTSVPGVFALGDIANHFQLKHMANAEMRVVRHNLTHPDNPRRLRSGLIPHAVFSDPQVASVGLTEREALHRGVDHVVTIYPYADTAFGWALEDTTSFVKLIADPGPRTLLGVHIIGPHAAILIQPLLQAMMLGQTVDKLAHDVLYIHPALTEVLEQALLTL